MSAIVALHQVSKDYMLGKTRVQAVRNASLQIQKGEFVSIVGPSGSGKTTLLNLIGCVDSPSSGSVIVHGQDTRHLRDDALADIRLRHIGFIFQSFNLIPVVTLFRNVEFPLLLQGDLTRKERHLRVMRLLERTGLAAHALHRPNELSGGQRQRAAIARALVTAPSLVLADEPTANLDAENGVMIVDLMRQMNEREGVTFIFSTHDERVMWRATYVIRIEDGKLREREESGVRRPPMRL